MPVKILPSHFTGFADQDKEVPDLPGPEEVHPRVTWTTKTSENAAYPEKQATSEWKEEWESMYDYKFLLAIGFVLILATLAHFYWLSVRFDVPEDEETNITMDFAIDKVNEVSSHLTSDDNSSTS